MAYVNIIIRSDIEVQSGFKKGLFDFALHLESQIIFVGNLVLAVHCDGEEPFLGTEVKDGTLEHLVLGVFVLFVHILRDFGYRVTEKVLDNSCGMGLTGSVGTFNPEGLVDIGVVVVNRADNLSKDVIELLICDEDTPCTILLSLDVVGGLLTSQRNDVRILSCHIIWCFLFLV